jgi:hypothetical protein
MRFVLFVVVAAATGAVSMTAMQTLVPTNAPLREAVQALGGQWAAFRLADYNPLTAYRKVAAEISKPGTTSMPYIGTTSVPSIQVTGPLFKPYEYKPDPGLQRATSAGIGARAAQEIRRAQDITAYGRNPTRWHGVPPH